MDQVELDRQMETRILIKSVGVFAPQSGPMDPLKEGGTDSIALPKSVAGTSVILFVATYIAQGFLQGVGNRIFQELFGGSSSPDLRRLMQEVFASLRQLLRDVLQEHDVEVEIDNTRKALGDLYSLLAEHLTNPPPQGPRDRIEAANLRALDLTSALDRLGVLGFHNYLAAIGCYLLVLTERARIDGPAEMKNACRQLQLGIAHAEETLVQWRRWSDSRLSTRETGWIQGEPTILQITMDGHPYRAAGVRGWYRLNDAEDEVKFEQEFERAKTLLWDDVRKAYNLDQADDVIQKWRDLKVSWIGLGFCM
ncbi:MAG: hypothetical protein QOF89_6095 [Acidobacteriota bacterium]|jgi:hypothetical protein|nr:hypothetical protein [Acidobacteriota bacterium]